METTGRKLTDAERFWRKVKKTEGCWEWEAYRDKRGYGRFRFESQTRIAHRVSWQLECGPIPEGKEVCHTCDNPPCVRPSHLFLGTHADNMKDMAVKGRAVVTCQVGENNHAAKLTTSDALEIYGSICGPVELSTRFGVSLSAVRLIKSGKRWRHVTQA